MNLHRYQVICHVLALICLIAKTLGIELQHDLEEPPTPRVYKILERNNRVLLQKDNSEGYNRDYFVKFLKNNADLEYRINNILYNNPDHLIETLGKRKRLIKRIVPHGMKTRDFQYDHRFKTFFKPLVRLHKTKLANGDNARPNIKIRNVNQETKNIEEFQKNNLANNMFSPLGKVYTSDQLIAPFNWQAIHQNREKNRLATGTVKALSQLKDAQQLIDRIKNPFLKFRLQDIFDNAVAQIADLYSRAEGYRSKLRGGAPLLSTPSPDHKNAITIMPGMKVEPTTEGEGPNNQPKEKHVSLWNYWTYENTLHQDECPGEQVKIGPFCSRTPPHRRK